jgi:hypothetical protein
MLQYVECGNTSCRTAKHLKQMKVITNLNLVYKYTIMLAHVLYNSQMLRTDILLIEQAQKSPQI